MFEFPVKAFTAAENLLKGLNWVPVPEILASPSAFTNISVVTIP
jgi:hypothetical protein